MDIFFGFRLSITKNENFLLYWYFLPQSTQIGRDVNGLRKLSSTIKTESKALVQKWKRLLPPAESDHHPQSKRAATKHTSDTCNPVSETSKTFDSVSRKSSKNKTTSSNKEAKSLDSFSKALLGMPVPNEDIVECWEETTPTPRVTPTQSHRAKDALSVSEPRQRSLSPRPASPLKPNDTPPIESQSSTSKKRKGEFVNCGEPE